MKEIAFSELQMNPYDKIGKEWMLCTAGGEGSYNTMTCSWGHLGSLWNLPTAICYVRPQRYTKEFIDREEKYTLCFFSSWILSVEQECPESLRAHSYFKAFRLFPNTSLEDLAFTLVF